MGCAATRTLAGLAATLIVSAIAGPSWGQSDAAIAARRVLLEQATAARASGDHSRAIDFAQQAGRILVSPSMRLFLAEEFQTIGRHSDALASADACVREAERDAGVPNREAILARCRAIVADARGRVALVTIRVAEPRPAGLRVTLAGQPVAAEMFGLPSAVDAGQVVVDARAGGGLSFRRSLDAVAGHSVEVDVALRVGGADPPVSATSLTGSGPRGATPGASDTSSGPGGRRGGSLVGPVVVMSVGGAALAASLAFFILRGSSIGNCTIEPTFIGCPTDADSERARGAYLWNTLTDVAFPVGLAAIGGGLIWLLVTPRGTAAPPTTAVSVAPVRGGVQLSIGGAL